ncbi:MAG: ornithine cyclodeaminase family protein [Lachnospiraceae bacterium]
MLLLNREDIKQVFTIKDAIEADKIAFKMVTDSSCAMPLRTNIPVPEYDGSLLFMPAYSETMDAAVLKIISLFPHNVEHGLPSSPAQVMLMDGKTGMVVSMMDGTYVTQLRTGAASGAAFDVLAKKECRKGALIGTGGQAATQLEAMIAVRKLEEVKVFDLNYERTRQFAERMEKELERYGTRILPAKSSDEAVEDADLLITVTPSQKPVFDAARLKEGITVSCVGAYQHHMQEMDPNLLVRASKIYFDSQDAVLEESGDIIRPLEQGIITKEDFTGNLGDVLAGKLVGRENEKEIIVFETVGVGAQDLVTAKEIYERARKNGVGTEWE